MNKPVVVKNLLAVVVLITLAALPVLAQRGGHGGGGGFHGGGGGFHGGGGAFRGGGGALHGGGYSSGYGGYHGGGGYYGGHSGYYGGGHYGGHGGYWGAGYRGGHGGYYGWRGGYGGYPWYGSGWGWGWGFGISLNFGGYWPAYPYAYGYDPGWARPYYPYVYPYPYYVPADPPPSNSPSSYNQSGDDVNDYPPAQQSSAPARQSITKPNSPAIGYASYTQTSRNYASGAASQSISAKSVPRQVSPPRPEVQSVIRALRGMPPEARQRQIDSGRYSNLSQKELEFAMYAAELPPSRVQVPPGASR